MSMKMDIEETPEGEKHSPLPWAGSGDRRGWYTIEDANGDEIVELLSSDGFDEPKQFPDKENRDLIVAAVNSYNPQREVQLIAALEQAKETIRIWHGEGAWEIYDEHAPEMKIINAALALANTQRNSTASGRTSA